MEWRKRSLNEAMGNVVIDPKNRRMFLYGLLPAVVLLCIAFVLRTTFLKTDYKERMLLRSGVIDSETKPTASFVCQDQIMPLGSEPLPKGIVAQNSNLEMKPLWGSFGLMNNSKASKSLLAITVGISLKKTVDEIVKKFISADFTVMLFHYDGVVDEWRDLNWADTVIHVSVVNQTKWWFAKRFLHPDIVSEYNYIFLWDEDLSVQHFNPQRYLSIVKEEGLEISQPALDLTKSEVHHRITVRGKKKVHRRIYKHIGNGRCYENSTSPPCVGWVEVMAPVFSKASWRCVWHMIQNDLIHAWGLDMKLGYCAQGDRTKNVGVVDSEYIIHKGIPTLGGFGVKKSIRKSSSKTTDTVRKLNLTDARTLVRIRSLEELGMFRERWQKAVEEDACWSDPFLNNTKKMMIGKP